MELSGEIVDPDGSKWIGMLGLGTLMSEISAKSTSPSARNFTLCTVTNYRRVFAQPSHHVLRRASDPAWPNVFGNFDTKELAGLSCEPCEGLSFSSVYFEIPSDEFGAIQAREDMYELVVAPAVTATGTDVQGYVCSATTDEKLREMMGDSFEEKYGRHFNGNPIPGPAKVWGWEGVILPARIYLRHCVLSIRNQGGEEAVHRFLDDTFLYDRKTTVRGYLASDPMIMETPPPVDHPDAYKFNG